MKHLLKSSFLICTIIILSLFVVSCSNSKTPDQEQTSNEIILNEKGTLDGYDKATKSIIKDINIWKNAQNRSLGIAGKGKHGEKVTLIKCDKEKFYYFIETSNGVKGWILNSFIKEKK